MNNKGGQFIIGGINEQIITEGQEPQTNSLITNGKFYIKVPSMNIQGHDLINFSSTFLLDTGTTDTYLIQEDYS